MYSNSSFFAGFGLMEATVVSNYNEYKIDEEILRINRYYNQSHCVTGRPIVNYCYCNDFL